MTQRLQGIADEAASGVAKMIIEGSNRLLGRSSNLLRILSNHSPYLARWFVGFVGAVRQPNLGATSDMRLRTLACIKTSMTNECVYCTTHTSILGQTTGMTKEELAAMKDGSYRASPLFSERDKAAIAWAEAVTRNTAPRDKALWAEMKRLFSDAEIVEITMASAMFNLINRLNDTFWTELETVDYNRRQGNAIKGLSVADIEAYAARFAPVGEAARAGVSTEAAE